MIDVNIFALERHELIKLCGVYFLFEGRRLVYIGSSINIMRRIFAYENKNSIEHKIFTHYTYMECLSDKLKFWEKLLIQKYRPKLNKNHCKKKIMLKINGSYKVVRYILQVELKKK